MKPYYDHAGITIYHADSREAAERVAADVVITDPPYGIGLVSKRNADYRVRGFDPKGLPPASVLYEDTPAHVEHLIASVICGSVERVGRALVFPGPKMLWAYPEPASVGTVWTPAGGGRTAWGFQCSHPILYYGKDPYLVDGKGGRPNGFKDDQPGREDLDHPCPKPLAWMTWAVNRASRPGETVLDPFMGSGTTLRAAKDLGRKAIGIEIEERYCEIAARRLGQEVMDFGEAGMTITLLIPGKPIGKARPRARGNGMGVYTPKETVEAEGNVRAAWHAAGQPRIEGRVPVKILVVAALRRPQGHWRVDGSLSKAGLALPFPVKKPDGDNLLKLQMDGLNGCAYDDDVLVVDARVVKRWAAPMESEHVRIELSEIAVAA